MSKRKIIHLIDLLLVITSVFLIVYVFTFSKRKESDFNNKEAIINQLTYLAIEKFHYHPKKFDDSLSHEIFREELKNFDNGKRFFTQQDIKKFAEYKDDLAALFELNNFAFLNLLVDTYNKRLHEVEGFYKQILSKPFDFKKKEYLETDPKKLKYVANDQQLRERWRKILKYETLLRLNSYLNQQEQAKKRHDTTYKYKTFAQLEAKARKEVLDQYKDWFSFMDKMKPMDWFSLYLNSILSTFDPYTQYFPPKTEENFKIYMSGKLEGIGATLQYKDGEIRVVKIIPGGAAWREGELEPGDVILKVAQDDKPPVSVVGMRLDDAVQLIRGPKGTKVRLTVRKPDGTIKEITIIRDVVIIEDTYVRTAVVSLPGSQYKFAYMYIPSFYADFSNPKGRRVYTDVEKELEKIKHDKLNGLIIDLRNNGGGSLEDVIKIVGMFIGHGPVVQVRDRANHIRVYSDNDPKLVYKKPVLIMINEFSASASEIFSAAMQDYHRGLIFGSKHSFGKGSVQTILDYDKLIRDAQYKPAGALKITIQKFYRINGGSTQLKGVTSDIIVPTPFMYIKVGERDEDYPLPWDKIQPAKYKLWKPSYNRQKVIELSQERIKHDTIFNVIRKYALNLKKQQKITQIPLNLEQFKQLQKQRNKANAEYYKLRKEKKNILVSFLSEDQLRFKTDTLARDRYQDWAKNIKKDIYLPEAIRTMIDMVEHK